MNKFPRHPRLPEIASPWNDVLAAALQAGDATRAVLNAWPTIAALRDHRRPLGIVAVGKAAAAMYSAVAEAVAGRAEAVRLAMVLAAGELDRSLPALMQSSDSLPGQVFACDHPLPTERNVRAAATLAAAVRGLDPEAMLVVLLSGGASACLASPREGVLLEDLVGLTRQLNARGATIRELNIARTCLEVLKGGGLRRQFRGRSAVTLVLSDVVGDDLSIIGSGPMHGTTWSARDAFDVLSRYDCLRSFPRIAAHLARTASAKVVPITTSSEHHVIASHKTVAEAVARCLAAMGFETTATTSRTGRAQEWADELARSYRKESAVRSRTSNRKPHAWILAGEPTVDVGDGGGVGGPSQEVALATAVAMHDCEGWRLLTFSTDGIDGPTHAAGAMVDEKTCRIMRSCGLDPHALLATHQSTKALEASKALLVTGPTGSNLNHIAVLLME